MKLFDNPYKMSKIRFYTTKAGDRTLTPPQKRDLKIKAGYKCDECHKKFHPRFLEVHHKDNISSYKSKSGINLPIFSQGKKYIPKYDRYKGKLQVLCLICHDKTKKKKK